MLALLKVCVSGSAGWQSPCVLWVPTTTRNPVLSLSDNCVPTNPCTRFGDGLLTCCVHCSCCFYLLFKIFPRPKTSERNPETWRDSAPPCPLQHYIVVNWLWLERLFRGWTDVATLPGCLYLLCARTNVDVVTVAALLTRYKSSSCWLALPAARSHLRTIGEHIDILLY